jgi:hypothetical protein
MPWPRSPPRRGGASTRRPSARLVEGQRIMGWREALNELDTAYPGRCPKNGPLDIRVIVTTFRLPGSATITRMIRART